MRASADAKSGESSYLLNINTLQASEFTKRKKEKKEKTWVTSFIIYVDVDIFTYIDNKIIWQKSLRKYIS